MYATENYVRTQARELQNQIKEVASDLGGDIKYIHEEMQELKASMQVLFEQLENLKKHE